MSQMENSGVAVRSAIKRIGEVAKSTSSRHMLYLVLFLVVVLLVLYVLVRRS